jgi:hypothetical protein
MMLLSSNQRIAGLVQESILNWGTYNLVKIRVQYRNYRLREI